MAFFAVRAVWLMACMAGGILHFFLSEIFFIPLNVKFYFENKLPGHHTHLLQPESLENWNSQQELGHPNEYIQKL
jgi:hypothetical protein